MALTLIIIAIFFSIIVAIHPFKIKKIPINIATGPIFIMLIFLLLQIIDINTIKLGILGNDQLKPWEIIIIFFTVAYISISLDVTGILDFLAYKIVRKAKNNGIKLFFFFYLFACLLTIFTSNDIVILTLTPIIFYLGKHAKLNTIPLLFAEFFGANTLSMLLYIGNPTNIIIGNTLGLGFLEYTKIMLLPTLIATMANLVLLYWFFRKKLSKKFKLNNNSHFVVRNWIDAIISSLLLILMLITLIISQIINTPIWVITSFFAVLFVINDIIFSSYYALKYKSLPKTELLKTKQEIFNEYGIPEKHNEFLITFKRIPWKILPFIAVFFILIAGLNIYGAIDWIATQISHISNALENSIITNGFISFFLANIINNQPMTILYSNIFINSHLQISEIAFQGGAYAVIIASNLGANFTLIGALAGLMWKKILNTKGLNINYLDFLKVGIVITPITFVLSLIALYFVLI